MHLFYQSNIFSDSNELSGSEFKHVQVLRKRVGDIIYITDGIGTRCEVLITSIKKKSLTYTIKNKETKEPKPFKIHIAIAPTKNIDRIAWFVEKACELGCDEISFIKVKNSERPSINTERLEKKSISALKQSKGYFKTSIHEMISLDQFLSFDNFEQRLITTVSSNNPYFGDLVKPALSTVILIGPEGDFSSEEIKKAESKHFQSVSLGKHILRTETAGIAACQWLNMINRV